MSSRSGPFNSWSVCSIVIEKGILHKTVGKERNEKRESVPLADCIFAHSTLEDRGVGNRVNFVVESTHHAETVTVASVPEDEIMITHLPFASNFHLRVSLSVLRMKGE